MDPQLIAGRYEVQRAIGRGGMGTVWLARDNRLGRDVAVKQIGALPGESANETRRAMREARSAAALNHPNAVAVYDVVDHENAPWLVMEYVEGETLADLIAREGALDPRRAADIGAQLASALSRAHERGIVHRDIKPGNVLIDRSGRPKISDFGIARGLGDDALTQTGFVTGTPGYLSPELARGEDPDAASDVWALGATLYAAVEGRPPFAPRSNPIALLQDIARGEPQPMHQAGELGGAIEAMMHIDPAQRWDMSTAAARLGQIGSGDLTMPLAGAAAAAATEVIPTAQEPTRAMPAAGGAAAYGPPTPDPTPLPAPVPENGGDDTRRSRRWVPLLVAALLLLALGGGYLFSQLGDETGTAGPRSTPSTTAPATTTQEPSPTTSEPPTTTTEPPTTTTTTTEDAAVSDRQIEQFVRGYFAEVTSNRDATWEQLTPRMQAKAGGRDGYEEFWSGIDSVDVKNVKADAEELTANVTLVYQKGDGDKSTEKKVLTLVQDGDRLLIDREANGGGD
ncbi:serine/threonine-protein kinase [Knoellia sp. 3-2P3]|uniref:serine/threonine-protein kinase n=1 Tax=unclassified Knoellia TaxID=2618719 RepID=UPI0023D9CC24|nr:serine/threonine-protein kinase [Knoellia sp. 3-2P3]MDF2093037.1 serine/threonine-protein kinase [Knoellia sp. 3-2P3]